MQFSVLGSGSRGNAVYIESNGTAVLIDAGFSGKALAAKLASVGKDVAKVKALLLTHEHNDHISGAGVISRRCRIAVHANHGTLHAGEAKLGKLHRIEEFETGQRFEIDGLEIRSFRTLHDTSDPVGFTVSDGKRSIGYCTDTGKVTHLMAARLQRCDAIILEFNHDPEMLRSGPYPPALQQRVRSSHGHLSNEDAADFLRQLEDERLKYVVLAHLSETNNLPEIAYKAAVSVGESMQAKLVLASQDRPMTIVDLRGQASIASPEKSGS